MLHYLEAKSLDNCYAFHTLGYVVDGGETWESFGKGEFNKEIKLMKIFNPYIQYQKICFTWIKFKNENENNDNINLYR